jgi:glycosyltransferase involved in cell wall biosynthesis
MDQMSSRGADHNGNSRDADRTRSLEQRIAELEARVDSLAQAYSRLRHQTRRVWLRPPMWAFEQHAPRPLAVEPNYQNKQPPNTQVASVAIVTPSFNQGAYLPATIASVLSQDYPHLTYRVQDGGSTDGTAELLRSYDSRLAWQSEPDGGQAQAINRAFAQCDGDIMGYLNSDDMLMPGTLAYIARAFAERPEIDIVYGHRVFVDRDGQEIGRAVLPRHSAHALYWADYVPQETMFWRRRVWSAIGPLDESFQYALDWDFLLRAQHAGFKMLRLPRFLACFRVHDEQKTSKIYDRGREEMQRLRQRYLGHVPSQFEIMRHMLPYLGRQLACQWMYRLGLLRY